MIVGGGDPASPGRRSDERVEGGDGLLPALLPEKGHGVEVARVLGVGREALDHGFEVCARQWVVVAVEVAHAVGEQGLRRVALDRERRLLRWLRRGQDGSAREAPQLGGIGREVWHWLVLADERPVRRQRALEEV